MLELPHYRWWELRVELKVVLQQVVVEHRHRHLRHLVSRKYLPLKPSCFANLFKGSSSSSSKMGTMSTNQKLLGIWIS